MKLFPLNVYVKLQKKREKHEMNCSYEKTAGLRVNVERFVKCNSLREVKGWSAAEQEH